MEILKTTPNFKTHTNIIKRHIDENGSQIVEQVSKEKKQVVKSHVVLEQIPHPHHTIEVYFVEDNIEKRLYSISYSEEITNSSQYKIDYTQGKVWVHPELEGKTLSISYWGIGYELIHASRVYTEISKDGDIVETLGDIITKSEVALKFLGDLPDVIIEGREIVRVINDAQTLKKDLETLIVDGNTLKDNLEENILIGSELKDNLDTNISSATDINTTLEDNITVGNELNTNLTVSIDTGTQLLDKTVGVTNTLTDLIEANRVAKEEILTEIDKFDNAKFIVFKEDWTLSNNTYTVTINHNLGSQNLITAIYDNNNKLINPDTFIIDENNIKITNTSAIGMTVIINICYRGKFGDIDGTTGGLSVSDVDNIKNIPNIEHRIDNILDVTVPEIYSSFTPDKLLEAIKTVDGKNSGLDSELLCGKPSNEYLSDMGGTLKNSQAIKGIDIEGEERHLLSITEQNKAVVGDIKYHTVISSKGVPEHYDGKYTNNILTGNNATVKAGALSIDGHTLYIQPYAPPSDVDGAVWIRNL